MDRAILAATFCKPFMRSRAGFRAEASESEKSQEEEEEDLSLAICVKAVLNFNNGK